MDLEHHGSGTSWVWNTVGMEHHDSGTTLCCSFPSFLRLFKGTRILRILGIGICPSVPHPPCPHVGQCCIIDCFNLNTTKLFSGNQVAGSITHDHMEDINCVRDLKGSPLSALEDSDESNW